MTLQINIHNTRWLQTTSAPQGTIDALHFLMYFKRKPLSKCFTLCDREKALTSGRLNDIMKSHTKLKVQGGPFFSVFFFFSLMADGGECVQWHMG